MPVGGMIVRVSRGAVMIVVLAVMPHLAMAQIDTLAAVGTSGARGTAGHLVQITLLNAESLAGLQLKLADVPNALVIDSVTTTPRSAGFTVSWNDSTQTIIMVDFSGQRMIPVGSGPVLHVYYRVRSDAAPGTVSLTPMNVILADPSAQQVPVVPVNGTFRVELPTGINEQPRRAPRPAEFALFQNYPNPFNPRTTIQYWLAAPGRVILKIFDLLGIEVRTLVDAPSHAGLFAVSWDGEDERGGRVSAGVYFYRLEAQSDADRFIDTKKLVLLR